FIANILHLPGDYWRLHGPTAGYYNYAGYVDDNGLSIPDPDHQLLFLGSCVWNDVTPGAELSALGELDTHTALLQKLSYPGPEVSRPGVSLVPTVYDSEELLISSRFKIDRDATTPKSSRPFNFYLAFRSRRITMRALAYGFALKALPIDGVDPVQ